MKAFEILKERGYIYQATDEEKIKKLLNDSGSITFYLGIDPTADSLHIGHFFALTMVRRLQKMGHKPIILVGGATALIGDPTGKKDMRKMLTKEQVAHNKAEVKELVKRFVDIEGENAALIVDNSDWINPQSYIDFMRNVGVHFNVNKMLATECYKNRLQEGGLTFLEMGYMLMQAYDFVYLNESKGCVLEIGGADQWANMIAGVELARKMDFANEKEDRGLEAVTCPLLVKADGEKMGKTASGTLWVSRDKTTVFDFYQMFMNVYDEDVERLLSFFSDFEIADIKKMCSEDIRNAKKVMAYEVTKLVHGEIEAKNAQEAAKALFEGKGSLDNAPQFDICESDLPMNIVDLLFNAKLVNTKSDGRRMVQQNAVAINDKVVSDFAYSVTKQDFNESSLLLRKGKKNFVKVNLK